MCVQAGMRGVEVPRSITKLTTQRVLTMSFVAGDPITRLKVAEALTSCSMFSNATHLRDLIKANLCCIVHGCLVRIATPLMRCHGELSRDACCSCSDYIGGGVRGSK